MAKQIWKALDNLSPSNIKLMNLPRQPDGLHNMHFNEYGQVEKRAGYAVYNTSLGGSHKIVGMHRYYQKDLTAIFLVSWYQNWYLIAETDPWGGTAFKSESSTDLTLTADKDTFFADFADVCYIVNGVNGVFKYDATAGTPYVRTVGVTAPTEACAGSGAGSSGYLGAGDYKYKYTWIDEDGYESNASPVVTITASALNTISLTDIDNSSDDKVVSKNIYRTAVGGAIFYYEGAIGNNTTTTFSSTIADGDLGTILHTDHTAPPTTSHLVTKRRNRIYLANSDYLYPSRLSDIEYFPALWAIRTGNGQKITGILEQLTALPVMTNDSVERLVGTNEDNFELKNSYSTEGNIALRSLVNCDNLLVYLGINGINYFDGVSSGIFSEKLNEYIKANIVAAYASLSCATYWDNKYILCYPKTGGTYPTETVWYDLKNKTYGVYSFAFSCFSLWDKGDDGLQLKGGSNTIGQVYSVFSGLEDNTTNIAAYDQIDYLDFGIPEVEKDYYFIYVRAEVTSASTLTVTYQTDIDTAATVTETLTTGKDQWYRLTLPGNVRGRAIKLKFGVDNKLAVKFKGYMIQYNIGVLKV